jgi:tetratricopeptide (TPR) repeat protein
VVPGITPPEIDHPKVGTNWHDAPELTGDARFYFDAAEALYAQRQYENAIIELNKAEQAQPNNPAILANLASAQELAGHLDDALATDQRLQQLEISPEIRTQIEQQQQRLQIQIQPPGQLPVQPPIQIPVQPLQP